ncbi:hypothetical protein [Salipiger sp. 1_MG-2023]|uniref:hypothetical protein n=1 Tax=Salipiger sp. 1_MG-2023 TaxID=3062665 RepID=UPI0026E464BA|nr:hypothetical protein [Salipiger sp. 1_MG-2023]
MPVAFAITLVRKAPARDIVSKDDASGWVQNDFTQDVAALCPEAKTAQQSPADIEHFESVGGQMLYDILGIGLRHGIGRQQGQHRRKSAYAKEPAQLHLLSRRSAKARFPGVALPWSRQLYRPHGAPGWILT